MLALTLKPYTLFMQGPVDMICYYVDGAVRYQHVGQERVAIRLPVFTPCNVRRGYIVAMGMGLP
mgnify:CR=1 FL=1